MKAIAIIQQLRKDMRSTSMHSSDPELRGGERHRRALLTGITSTAARAVSVGVSLITIPLTLHYLGSERFGLWMTISSVLAMAGFADFGIGNGVLNTIATAFGKDDMAGIRHAISSGFFVLSIIATALLALFLSTYRFVVWGNLFRATSVDARMEAGPAMAVFAICFLLNIPLDVVQRVQLGLQQGFRSNFWQLCSSLLALLGILAVIHFRLGLPMLVAAFAGAPVLGVAMNAVHFFGFARRDLLPQWHFVSRKYIAQIAKLGGLFFVLQVVVAMSYSADNFIVARTLGVAEVTLFSIPQRMFSFIALLVAMLMAPLWPAYAEAISRGDTTWVRRTLSRTLLGVFVLTTAASTVLLLLSNRLILWWVGPQVRPPFLLLLGLAIWTVMSSCGNTLAMFLNGASIVRFQLINAAIFGIPCLVTKIIFARHYGVVGVPWAAIITYSLFIALPCAIYVPRLLKRMSDKAQAHTVDELTYNMMEDQSTL